jgi:hypothetical protein
MSARDKLLQAEYFLERFALHDTLDATRFNWSAFVSAWRSVTFVLQKDYKGQYKQEFEDWYAEKQRVLRELPFAGSLLQARQRSIHEGDTFPLVIIKARDAFDNKYEITWGHLEKSTIHLIPA